MSISKQVMHGLSWTALGQVLNTGLAFVVSIILARLLSPFDFGVVAIALGVLAVMNGLVDFGLPALIIRVREIPQDQLSGLFVARLLIGLLQMLVIYLCSPLLATFFRHPELVYVIQTLTLVFFVSSFSMVPEALLRKQLEFKVLASVAVVSNLLSGALGIGMALSGYGLWSLVAQYLASAVVNAGALFYLCHWRPSLEFNFKAVLEHRHFISNIYGLNIVGALVFQADRLVLGRLLGANLLGLYMRGVGLAQQAQGLAVSVAEQVGFPALSAINHDPDRRKRGFLKIIGVLGGVIAPAMLLLAALAEPIVLVLFGKKWLASAPVLQLIAIGMLFNAINISWDWLLRAMGRADVLFKWALLDGSLRITALAGGAVAGGMIGAAIGFTAISVPLLLLRAWYFGRISEIGAQDFLAALLKPFALAICVGGVAFLARGAGAEQAAMQLISGLLAGALAYLVASRLLGNPLLSRMKLFGGGQP